MIQRYKNLLLKWNKAYNLVSRETELLDRYIAESQELLPFIPSGARCLDVGSGAGFPGVVLALQGGGVFTLVDPVEKKCRFLREVSRVTNASYDVIHDRVERVHLPPFDVIVSRAFTSVKDLLVLTSHLRHEDTIYLLMKTKKQRLELDLARERFDFIEDIHYSNILNEGLIFLLKKVKEK